MEYTGTITSLKDLYFISQKGATDNNKLSGSFQYYRGHGFLVINYYPIIQDFSVI